MSRGRFACATLGMALASTAALAALGWSRAGGAAAQAPGETPAEPAAISDGGFTVRSTAIELPPDQQTFPAGPNVDLVDRRCRACHSASMVLQQPAMSREQWLASVVKMRDVYRAPVGEAEVAAIVEYLAALDAPAPR